MKKFLVIILLLIFFTPSSIADEQKSIQFIYINGSNNNDKKMKNWFFDGMNKLHPYMYKEFSNSNFVNEYLLKNGEFVISSSPEAYFWGDMSKNEIEKLNSEIKSVKKFSPKIAQTVRRLLAHYLHDAIWVSHYHNMKPVLDGLHKQVLSNYNNGNSVVLFGYSAGAFVAYEYIFNKLPNVNVEQLLLKSYGYDLKRNFPNIKEVNDTCIDALITSKFAIFSADNNLILNPNIDKIKSAYSNLNEYTCNYCAPKGAVKGIVNFASPLVLFYSDISNPNYPLTYHNKLLYKYILENDMFWLTVNFADDPLGYPVLKNLSFEQIKNKLDIDISPNYGFLYSKSNVKSPKTVLGAHTSYWSSAKKFSKAVVAAYQEGYSLYNLNPEN